MIPKLKLLLSCVLLFSSIGISAKEFSVTYEPTDLTTVSTSGDAPEGSVASYAKTGPGKTCNIITAGDEVCLKLSGFDGMTIKSITLKMRSNQAAGAGSLSVTCGDNEMATIANAKFSNSSWYGQYYYQNFVDITPAFAEYTVSKDEILTISIKASVSSLYCKSYTIVYDDVPHSVTCPSVDLLSGAYFGAQQVKLSLPDDNTATKLLYTTDGTDPCNAENNPAAVTEDTEITLSAATKLKVVAANDDDEYSNVIIRNYDIYKPIKTNVALAGTYSSKLYAMSAEDLSAVEVTTLNGKIIADADMKEMLAWNIYEAGDSNIIRNNSGKFLSVIKKTYNTLSLGDDIYRWGIHADSSSWIKDNCSFMYYKGNFTYSQSSYIKKTNYQSDYTKAYPIVEGYERTGLTAGKLATICLPCGVGEDDFSGAVFYEIVGVVKATDNMAVNDITGLAVKEVKSLVAGKPYLMQPTSATLIAAYDDTKAESAVSATGLVGNISGEKVYVTASDDTHWNYIVNNNQLRKVVSDNTASIANNRAYINLYGVPRYAGNEASAKVITLYDETSGINALPADNGASPAFLLDGTKANASQMQKGVIVMDGRKYLVK